MIKVIAINKKIIISWLLVAIWMLVIFFLSNMNTFESNNSSKNVINKVIETTVEATNKIGITDKHPSEKKKDEITNILNLPFRKFAHAGMYLILVILLINALIASKVKFPLVILLALIISFLYACSDEYHQTFIFGRTGKFTDVLIDTGGIILGIIIYTLAYFIYRKKKTFI